MMHAQPSLQTVLFLNYLFEMNKLLGFRSSEVGSGKRVFPLKKYLIYDFIQVHLTSFRKFFCLETEGCGPWIEWRAPALIIYSDQVFPSLFFSVQVLPYSVVITYKNCELDSWFEIHVNINFLQNIETRPASNT